MNPLLTSNRLQTSSCRLSLATAPLGILIVYFALIAQTLRGDQPNTWSSTGSDFLYQIDESGWSGSSETSDAVNGWGDDQWQLTLTSPRNVSITVVDCCIVGDNYEVYVDSTLIGTTPPEPLYGPVYSQGTFTVTLTPGAYLIQIRDPGAISYYQQGDIFMIPAGYTVTITTTPSCTATAITVASNENCDPTIDSSCTPNIVFADGSEGTDVTTVVAPAQSVQVNLSTSFGTVNNPTTDPTGKGVSRYVSGVKSFGDISTSTAEISAQVCGSSFPNLAHVFNYRGFDFHTSHVSNTEFINSSSMTQAQIQKFFEDQSSFLANFYLVGQIGGFLDMNGNGKLDAGEPTYSATGVVIPLHATGTRASSILSAAATQQGVNPKILLATLEKENSLISSQTLPSAGVLNIAMGVKKQPYNFVCQINFSAQTFINRFNDGKFAGRTIVYPFFFHATDGIRHAVTGLTGLQAVGFQINTAATYAQYRYTPYIQSLKNGGGVYRFETLWEDFGF